MKTPQGKKIINDMTDLIVPAALRIWLVFLLVFVLLGYPVTVSILFGAVGGFAGGLVSAWWYAPGGEPMPKADGQTLSPMLQLPKLRWRGERRHLRRRQR
ncbi:hypothetical protein D0962_13000 [Leptolyngbyaceae cyanobacterium CCMR0082]|uniref:Uncharacterized protein n=2 Tax=Adonisia turfae TaxID=2950184 RepID=A0A6M0S5R2_9CYAN|nr:hypothetical protein [Adonisia turfae]MDV3353422.1 hypothetical protein [Leptothoe sp. LEGE 181152]NEZ60593.1 hypothetical protein [Adonisia turfae CCMR0081]NEZ63690.1 hypothetical protein [Adonisia turfae CCMR0082]